MNERPISNSTLANRAMCNWIFLHNSKSSACAKREAGRPAPVYCSWTKPRNFCSILRIAPWNNFSWELLRPWQRIHGWYEVPDTEDTAARNEGKAQTDTQGATVVAMNCLKGNFIICADLLSRRGIRFIPIVLQLRIRIQGWKLTMKQRKFSTN